MTIRAFQEDKIEILVDSLWLLFAEEMTESDAYNNLAANIREVALLD